MLQQTPTISPTGLAAGTWLVDPNAGRIAFAVKTLWGLVDVKGTFDRFEGVLQVTETNATGELIVHTDSLDTKHKKRDEHLRSADFFDSRSHPRVKFATTQLTTNATGVTVSGELIVGSTVTRLDLPATVEADGAHAVIRAAVALAREDVGLTWNQAGMIKGKARIEVELHLIAPE